MLPDIESTSQTGLKHLSGTLSLARDLLGTGHVLPEFFICIDPAPSLDERGRKVPDTKGFPAFGRVVEGMDIVRSIAERDTEGDTVINMLSGEILTNPVDIIHIRIDNTKYE